MTNKAHEADIEQVIEAGGNAENNRVREHYRVLLKLVIEKNPGVIETIRRDKGMEDVLMEIVKDRVDEKVSNAVSNAEAAKEQETLLTSIRNIMDTLKLTVSQAMDALKIPDADRPVYAEKLKRS